MTVRPVLLRLGVLAVAATLTACSSGAAGRASTTFDDSAGHPDCMPHQSATPSATQKSGADVAKNLVVLRYYTDRGLQSYCDGKPASTRDLQWMSLYVAQGADRSHVARWVPAS